MHRQFQVRRWLILLWVLLYSLCFIGFSNASAVAPASAASVNKSFDSSASAVYLAKINTLRAQKNLPPLRLLSALNESARNKAAAMATQHYWGHYAPDGTSFKDYIWQTTPKAKYIGENLARCYPTRDDAFSALVASPTHYEIMVGDFEYLGVSEVIDSQLSCTITAFHFAQL